MSEAEAATANEEIEEQIEDMDERLAAANGTVRNHMLIATGVGVLPFPIIDLAALTVVQMNMIRRLSRYYGVTFSERPVRNIITSLVGSVLPMGVAGSVASLVKMIPVVGTGAGMLTLPVLAGGATYALGKVIVTHLESGGTFLDLDPVAVREHFEKEFEEGKSKASRAKS